MGDLFLPPRSSSSTSTRSPRPTERRDARPVSPLADGLLRACDGGILAMLLVAPLFMGGRHPLGQLVVTLVALVTAALWLARQAVLRDGEWIRTGCEWLLFAGLALLLLQLAPLPESLLVKLSPALVEQLPLWFSHSDAGFQLGTWKQTSLTPDWTREALAVYLGYALFFWVVAQRLRTLDDVQRVLKWVALASVAMATLGLAQFFTGSGKFLWVYEHPERTAAMPVRGAFINENHFSHFLALGVGPLLVWFHNVWSQPRETRRSRQAFAVSTTDWQQWLRFLPAAALGLVGYATLLTYSRGGVIVVFVAAAVCVGVLVRASLLGKKAVFGLLAIGGVMGAALVIFGFDQLATEMETVTSVASGSFEKLDPGQGRRLLWLADFRAFCDYPLLGTGVGSHREVYPRYFEQYSHVEFTHAESGYVQIMLETGCAGLLLLAWVVGLMGCWCYRMLRPTSDSKVSVCAAAIVSGLAVSLLHAVWDFAWYLPACMSMTIVLLACACRVSQLVRVANPIANPSASLAATPITNLRSAPREVWGAACVAVLVLAVMAVHECLPSARASAAWDRFKRTSILTAELRKSPTELDDSALAALSGDLDEVLRCDPHNARAHVRRAQYYLTQFDRAQQQSENAIELVHIRDAALASEFKTQTAQDEWLDVVVGENRGLLDRALDHSRRAVELSPLLGEAYLYLAQLSFLTGVGDAAKPVLVDQALRVRPHSGEVLVAAGAEAGLAEQPELQLKHWKEAFHQSPDVQRQLVKLLAPQQSADDFLRHFDPPKSGLRALFDFYVAAKRADDAVAISEPLLAKCYELAQAARGKPAAELWGEAQMIHAVLEQRTEAIECARRSLQQTPDDWRRHQLLAHRLGQNGEWAEAVAELKWCTRRRPDDADLARELAAAFRQQQHAESESAASGEELRQARAEAQRSR